MDGLVNLTTYGRLIIFIILYVNLIVEKTYQRRTHWNGLFPTGQFKFSLGIHLTLLNLLQVEEET